MSILIRFASTHFPDDTNLEIYAEGRDSAGQTGSASRYVLVYNKATLYGRTVFYVHTHGDVGVFASDSDELTGVAEEIFPGDVLLVRQSAVGNGYPPFNTGNPPIGMVLIDACLSGTDNSFNVFLYPYYNGYNTNWCENQAVVGWRELIFVDKSQARAEAFWSALSQGQTAHQARDQMVRQNYYPYRVPGEPRDHASVWGDYYARLSGAYTGSDSLAPHFWW